MSNQSNTTSNNTPSMMNMNQMPGLLQHQMNNNNNNNNGGNALNTTQFLSNMGGMPGNLSNGHGNPNMGGLSASALMGNNNNNMGMAGGAPNGMLQSVQLTGISDINQMPGTNAALTNTNQEIQRFAEQSRNHGKMIEYFIEHHLPPLMKTDKLIKELGKMDFDTFQQNSQNPGFSNDFGFDFGHNAANNSNNNNGLPGLEREPNSQTELFTQEIQSLQLRLNGMQKTEKELREKNLQLQEKCSRQDKELSQLRQRMEQQRLMLISTKNVAISGGEPRHHLVSLVKQESGENNVQRDKCTKSVDRLRAEIVKRKNIDLENWNIEADKEFNSYLDSILNYLMANDENGFAPALFLGSESEKQHNQSEFIEKFGIDNNHRISQLNGRMGLRAKRDLPENTVLGQYCGIEYLLKEFEDVYNGTKQGDLKNIYAFNLEVLMPKQQNNNNNNIGNGNGNDDNGDLNMGNNEYIEGKKYQIVIDALLDINNTNNRILLTYINDCRSDISGESMQNNDKAYENIKFVKVFVNGWPMIFVVTSRDIKQNDEIMGYYGKEYGLAIQAKKRMNDIRQARGDHIDQNVFQGRVDTSDSFDLTGAQMQQTS